MPAAAVKLAFAGTMRAVTTMPLKKAALNPSHQRAAAASQLARPAQAARLNAPAIDLTAEAPFSDSALPRTMGVARRHRRRILAQLARVGEGLPFEDRVLIWLAAHWKDDVENYHRADGKGMTEWFQSHVLERMDDHYHSLLRSRLGVTPRARRRPLAIWCTRQ